MRLLPFAAPPARSERVAGAASNSSGGAPERIDVALLLHGFGADRLSWVANAPALGAAAHVLAPDLPGHGTAADTEAVDVETLVEGARAAVRALLDERAARGMDTRLHLVGHSLGGALAIRLAAELPVASLSVAAPGGLGTGIDVDWLRALVALEDEASAMTHLARLVADPRMISRQAAAMLLAHLDRPGVRGRLDALARDLGGLAACVRPALAAVVERDVPRLCVWGEADAVNPPDEARVAAFGGSDVRFERCGHLPHVERASRFTRLVLERMGAAPGRGEASPA